MPAGSKALYVGSFILRLPCRASRGEPGLINNYAPSTLSLFLSFSLFPSLLVFLSLHSYFRSISLSFSSLSLRFFLFSLFFCRTTFVVLFVFPLGSSSSLTIHRFSLLSLASFFPFRDDIKANLQQRVRGRQPERNPVEWKLNQSLFVISDRLPFLFIADFATD